MSLPLKEYEGVWEEILAHADEFAGQQVHLTVLPAEEPKQHRYQSALDLREERKRNPLTAEDIAILDEFEQFQKEQRRRFYGDEEEA